MRASIAGAELTVIGAFKAAASKERHDEHASENQL
jgi:hypothetical protein